MGVLLKTAPSTNSPTGVATPVASSSRWATHGLVRATDMTSATVTSPNPASITTGHVPSTYNGNPPNTAAT